MKEKRNLDGTLKEVKSLTTPEEFKLVWRYLKPDQLKGGLKFT